MDLSVVMPSYNSAEWLPSTIDALARAIREAKAQVELIVVDDGSTDETPATLAALTDGFPGDLRVVRQENRGRYSARLNGLQHARSHMILLLDARVLIDVSALKYVMGELRDPKAPRVWNAHAVTDPSSPLVGLFWDVPTHVFWGRYLRSPRAYDLTEENFDSAPKGTTMFLAPKEVLEDAFEFARPTADGKLVSDDTRILRRIAQTSGIRIDPGFAVIYRPRTTIQSFVAHAYHRGTVFVDGYAGTTPLRSFALVGLVLAPVVGVTAVFWAIMTGRWRRAASLMGLMITLPLSLVAPAIVNRVPARSVTSYLLYAALFAVPFWRGLARGLIVHRRAFRRATRTRSDEVALEEVASDRSTASRPL